SSRRGDVPSPSESSLLVSLSNHERNRSSFDSSGQAQDERMCKPLVVRHSVDRAHQPVVKVWLDSTGDASPPHPNAAAALGTPAPAALLLAQILPVLPPHRAKYARRGPRFSAVRLRSRDTLAAANFGETSPKPWRRRVAPCRRGASPVSVRRQTLTTGCYAAKRFSRQDLLSTRPAQGFANPWIMWQRDCSSDGVFNITM